MAGQRLTTRPTLPTTQETDLIHVVRDNKSYQQQVGSLRESLDNSATGGVTYQGGMNYHVWASKFTIDSIVYNTFVGGVVTLDDGGASLGRLDRFAVEVDTLANPASASIIVIKGTEAANPVLPSIDLVTQAEISFILVNANDTSNPDIIVDLIYDENVGVAGGEWDNTVNTVGGDLAYTIDPYNGVNSFLRPINIAAPSVVTWLDNTTYTFNKNSKLVFAYKGDLQSNASINFKLINSSDGAYYLKTINSANIASYGYSD